MNNYGGFLMKRFISLCLLSLVASMMRGQYVPFLQEGKCWKMAVHDGTLFDFPLKNYVYWKIEGDTLIEGKSCKFLVIDYGNWVNRRVFYEERGKVYTRDSDRFRLVYDFSCQVGDDLTLYSYSKERHCVVEKIDHVLASGGQTLRRYHLREYECLDGERLWDARLTVWLEGVGARPHPNESLGAWGMTGNTIFLESCWQDGELFATASDFHLGLSITSTAEKNKGLTVRYTLDGCPLQGPPRGLYLVRQADGCVRLEVAR